MKKHLGLRSTRDLLIGFTQGSFLSRHVGDSRFASPQALTSKNGRDRGYVMSITRASIMSSASRSSLCCSLWMDSNDTADPQTSHFLPKIPPGFPIPRGTQIAQGGDWRVALYAYRNPLFVGWQLVRSATICGARRSEAARLYGPRRVRRRTNLLVVASRP